MFRVLLHYSLHTIVQGHSPLYSLHTSVQGHFPLYSLHTIVQRPLSIVHISYNCSGSLLHCTAYIQLFRGHFTLYTLHTIVGHYPLYTFHTIVQRPCSIVQLTNNCAEAIFHCTHYIQLFRGPAPLYSLIQLCRGLSPLYSLYTIVQEP